MQPSAVGALGDLIDYFQDEVNLRQTLRRQEVDAIRERVIQTLEMAEPVDPQAPSWLTTCVISLEATSIGIAIPLSDEGISAAGQFRRGKSARSRPAFLVTIDTVKFSTRRGSAGFAAVNALAFHFVSDFDQGRKEDYEGSTHEANKNRIRFPEMSCKLRSPTNAPVLVHSVVVGIEIDLEATAVAYAFSLIDIFTLSQERFAKFAPQAAVVEETYVTPLATPDGTAPPTPLDAPSLRTGSSGWQVTFEFKSGRVRMHAKASPIADRPPPPSKARPPHLRGYSMDASTSPFRLAKLKATIPFDQFNLPGMSLWAEYQHVEDVERLHVDISIHSSSNIIEPTLIPFITDLATQLKARVLRSPVAASPTPLPATPPSQPPSRGTFARLKFNVSLKIDESDLVIGCKPAPVRATLKWASGGFLLSSSPDVQGFDFVVQVDGVSASLEHNFSPEKCLLAEARGITASVSLSAPEDADEGSTGVLSVAVDLPDVSAEVNFRHLQVWLAFKAVWIDRMDLGTSPSPPTPSSRGLVPIPEVAAPPSQGGLTTIILVELKKVRFTCDLGQSIGRFIFLATSIDCRLRWVPGQSRRLGVGIGRLELTGQGRAGGIASVNGVIFETLLRDEGSRGQARVSDLVSSSHIRDLEVAC